MKKVILHMQITLDGVVSSAEKWFSENFSDDAFNDGICLYEAAAAQLLGFGAYEGMASYWQNATVDPNASALDSTMGRILNAKKKVVFSKKDEKLKWENSEIRRVKNDDDLIRNVKALKNPREAYMVLSGGANIAQSLGHTYHVYVNS